MSEKNYQALAEQYYRITEQTYRKLVPDGTDLMNLGAWPAQGILEAQKNIYNILSELCFEVIINEDKSYIDLICELGCGWGGGLKTLEEKLNPQKIIGINNSKTQIEYCKEKYKTDKFSFNLGCYESAEIQQKQDSSLVVAVESLLHCGNRNNVFEMIKANNFNYIALAEILLIDKKASSHKLFNPALKFAADFNEYQGLFLKYGYKLVVEKDITKNVFMPWANALRELTSHLTGLHKKIKDQFIESYSALAELSEQGASKYVLFVAKKLDVE